MIMKVCLPLLLLIHVVHANMQGASKALARLPRASKKSDSSKHFERPRNNSTCPNRVTQKCVVDMYTTFNAKNNPLSFGGGGGASKMSFGQVYFIKFALYLP